MSAHNTFQPGLLRNKAVFITGGGSGINRQIALTYAQAGAAVAIVGRSAEKALDAAAEIEASGGRAIGLSADVRSYEALRGAVEQAHEIADLALYLASDSGRYINGVVIPIDGGFSAVGSLEFGRMLKDSVAQAGRAAA